MKEEKQNRPPSREGKKVAQVFIDPKMHKKLAMIALEETSSIQELLLEGIEAVLKKRQKKK